MERDPVEPHTVRVSEGIRDKSEKNVGPCSAQNHEKSNCVFREKRVKYRYLEMIGRDLLWVRCGGARWMPPKGSFGNS